MIEGTKDKRQTNFYNGFRKFVVVWHGVTVCIEKNNFRRNYMYIQGL